MVWYVWDVKEARCLHDDYHVGSWCSLGQCEMHDDDAWKKMSGGGPGGARNVTFEGAAWR